MIAFGANGTWYDTDTGLSGKVYFPASSLPVKLSGQKRVGDKIIISMEIEMPTPQVVIDKHEDSDKPTS